MNNSQISSVYQMSREKLYEVKNQNSNRNLSACTRTWHMMLNGTLQ